ncbi:helix-turn-helix domain-containing protein [Paenibacillus sp. TRM 82003]|nr:helix-turn-helix domain-containing protein [Paenibacillus sp. TRM 82003]
MIPKSTKLHAYPPRFRSKPARLASYAIAYVAEGAGTIRVDGVRSELFPGRCFLLAPGMRIRFTASADVGVKLYYAHYIRLKHEESSPFDVGLLAGNTLYVDMPSKADALAALRRLARASEDSASDPGSALRRHYDFSSFLLKLLEGRRLAVEPEETEPVRRAMTYMDRHYADAIEPGLLPRLAGMTPSSFCRAFKRETGRSPGTYLSELRVAKAKELMAQPEVKVKELARHVGFQDELYFSRVFKKTEGLSPTLYLKRRRRDRIAVVSGLLLQDHLLALGVSPVSGPAYPTYFDTSSGFPSYLHSRLAGTEPLNVERTVAAKEVLRADPDLVLKTDFRFNPNDEQWTRASADTVFLEHEGRWEHFQRVIGAQLGREREAETVIRRVGALEVEAAARLRGAGKSGTWAIVRALPGDCRVYGVSGHPFAELFYERLSFRPHPRLDHASYRSDGLNVLLDADPDNVLLLWSEPEEIARLAADPNWRSLRAYQHGRIFVPNSKEWDPWGPFGREFMLRRLAGFFERRLRLSTP